jgi:MFS family permease
MTLDRNSIHHPNRKALSFLIHEPRKFSEVSVGVTSLLFIIGMAIGPAISGLFLQNFTQAIDGIGSFPSSHAYDMIFLIAAFISISPVVLILIVNKNLKYPYSN